MQKHVLCIKLVPVPGVVTGQQATLLVPSALAWNCPSALSQRQDTFSVPLRLKDTFSVPAHWHSLSATERHSLSARVLSQHPCYSVHSLSAQEQPTLNKPRPRRVMLAKPLFSQSPRCTQICQSKGVGGSGGRVQAEFYVEGPGLPGEDLLNPSTSSSHTPREVHD